MWKKIILKENIFKNKCESKLYIEYIYENVKQYIKKNVIKEWTISLNQEEYKLGFEIFFKKTSFSWRFFKTLLRLKN